MATKQANKPVLAGILSKELDDFVGAKFYCLHALMLLLFHASLSISRV